MAASSKFDLSSSSSDGPPGHSVGQRVAASLERPASFREAAENRLASSLPSSSSSRAGPMSSPCDAVSLLQSLVADIKPVVDQKLPRHGELKRTLNSILCISQEEMLPTFTMRPLPSSSVEELRRLMNNIQEGEDRASNRAKAFSEATVKVDKYYSLSRKRSRTDISSSGRANAAIPGGGTLKMGSQSQLTASSLDMGPHKSEERVKSGAPNRKIRTSLLDMDARPNSISRSLGPMDKDVFKLANSGATPPEEKSRPLAAAVDTWEKSKMKKKRSVIKSDASVNAVSARPHDGDREFKRGIQQRLITEARPRLNNAHSFRANGREESYAASPTATVKINNTSVRGPRSNSGSVSKTSSPNMNRAMGNSDDWDNSNSTNKINGVVGAVNRKRSASARSSSPPVAHWGGQRLQKMTRVARRSNLPPVGTSREDFPASDMHDSVAVNDDGLGFTRCSSANASRQSKSRGDQLLSSGLSESEDSGVVDIKSKDKSKKSNEMDEKAGSSIQKVATLVLPSRKSKVVAEEDQEDGVRRHGKVSRSATPVRSCMTTSNGKLDGVPTAKQMRTARMNYDKNESKSGRSFTKKWSERKGQTRPRHSATGPHSDFAGESIDDHEELLAAANAALDSKKGLGEFWKQNEKVFGFLSLEDLEFLNQQIRLSEDTFASASNSGDGQILKGGLEQSSVPSTPTLSSKDGFVGSSNGAMSLNERLRVAEPANQAKHTEPLLEDLMLANSSQTGISICQVLLSAIIDEEEIENFNHRNNEEDSFYGNTYGLHFRVDADLKSKSLSVQSYGSCQAADGGSLYSYEVNTGWGYHDEFAPYAGCNGHLDELVPSLAVPSSPSFTEFQYNKMSINDRILLELGELGIHPEPVPCLSQSEDEDINEGISKLTANLSEKVSDTKTKLVELAKLAVEARMSQQRKLERTALDNLVQLANDKYKAACGSSSSSSKNMNRANKQAALAFVERTLARCRKFEETGISCFSEPPFRDMFFKASSKKESSQPGQKSDMPSADRSYGLASHLVPREDRSVNHFTEQTSEDQWSNKLKKKELLLDEVVGSATGSILRGSSGLGGPLISGTKGKRSERDREGKGQSASRNGTPKIGRPAVSNVKGERKKSKPKQKMTQLSASVQSLLGKAPEPSPSAPKPPRENTKKDETSLLNYTQDLPADAESMDLLHLDDVGDFGGQGQDIATWLNIEEEGLQDDDFMGLEIPMDDLSEVNMMF